MKHCMDGCTQTQIAMLPKCSMPSSLAAALCPTRLQHAWIRRNFLCHPINRLLGGSLPVLPRTNGNPFGPFRDNSVRSGLSGSNKQHRVSRGVQSDLRRVSSLSHSLGPSLGSFNSMCFPRFSCVGIRMTPRREAKSEQLVRRRRISRYYCT